MVALAQKGMLELMVVDGGPTGEAMAFARATEVTTIIVATRVGRRVSKGWMQTIVVVRHEEVGGVTDTHTHLSRLKEGEIRSTPPRLTKLAPRDVSTILDVKGIKVVFRDAPKLVAVEPLVSVLNLGQLGGTPSYHGGGLLPEGVNCSTGALTPSIYARKGKWGSRALTHEEVLKAKDFSSDDIERLEPFVLNDIARLEPFVLENGFYEALIPGKCLTEGIKALMNGGGWWTRCH
jgi:hypothetical protein